MKSLGGGWPAILTDLALLTDDDDGVAVHQEATCGGGAPGYQPW